MFKRLMVQDFQSIALADLELKPFTVLIGDNRSGKTAILRALRALITNKSGNGFIRRGRPLCAVTLETSEGNVITWQKNKTTARYIWQGRNFSKMAGSVPDEIRDMLGVREIVVDPTLTLMPQMAKDTELLFLLDKSAGQAARALAKLTRLDVVVKAQILCKQFIRSLRDEQKAAKANITRTELELEEFAALQERMKKNLAYVDCYDNITKLFGKLSRVNALMETFREANEIVAMRAVPPVRTETLATLPIDLDCLLEAVELARTKANLVSSGDPPPLTPDMQLKMNTLEKAVELETQHFCEKGNYEEDCEDVEKLGQEQLELEAELTKYQGLTCPVCGGTL